MPKKTISTDNAAAATAPALAAKPKTTRPTASSPRVKTVKHSKAPARAVIDDVAIETTAVETIAAGTVATLSAHEQIAKIAYGYWAARGFQHGSAEQDWLRAEQEFLLGV